MTNSYRFEYILQEVGTGHWWHAFTLLILGWISVFNGLHNMSSVLLLYTPDHWCQLNVSLPDITRNNNWTQERIKELAIPRIGHEGPFSMCEIYVQNYSAALSVPWSKTNPNRSADSLAVERCSSWDYDTSQMTSTLVTRWDLVCSNTAYASIGKTAYMIGMCFGSIVYGCISDRYGRRTAVLLAVTQYVTSALLAIYAPYYFLYITLRMLTGMAGIGAYMCAYIFMNETVLPQHRGFLQIIANVFFSLGLMILPGIAYIENNWRSFYLIITLSSFSLFSFYWIFPESPRWLVLLGRKEEARKIIRKIANVSGHRDTTDEKLMSMISKVKNDEETETKSESQWAAISNLVRASEMRKNTLICCYMWASVTCAYYGITFSSPKLGSDIFFMVFLMGACELPSGIIGALMVKCVSRKTNICSNFILTGIFCLAYGVLPIGTEWIRSTVIMMGRMTVTVAFCFLYLMTSELFPTSHRNIAMGINSMFARVGAVIAAFTVDFLSPSYAMAIFGVVMIFAGGLSIILHETGNKSLPETENDVQHFEELEIRVQEEGGECEMEKFDVQFKPELLHKC